LIEINDGVRQLGGIRRDPPRLVAREERDCHAHSVLAYAAPTTNDREVFCWARLAL